MNILDKLSTIPGLEGVFLGVQPDAPDGCVTLLERESALPVQHFGGMDVIQTVQAKIRDATRAAACARSEAVAAILSRYSDEEISCIQSSSILDVGQDSANPPRHQYTVNFTIRRY